jgi:hypothetical protein
MFIIYGTRTFTSTFERGSFHCPQCRGDRDYNHRRVKNWFTLYFIPVIPLDTRGCYVECRGCSGTFTSDVLHLSRPAQPAYTPPVKPPYETGMHEQIKRLFILAAVTSGKPSVATTHSLLKCYKHLANEDLEPFTVEREINLAIQARTDIHTFAQKVSHVIDPALRPKVLAGVHLILRSQRGNAVASVDELRKLGQALQINDRQLETTLATLTKAP